jgi:cysteinyl-tRNA synthetase
MGRKLAPFVPIEDKRVKLYACGPTVYNFAHIGNLRTYIFVDTLRRTLEYLGYHVEHVMNVTDVGHLSDDADDGEDKVVGAAKKAGKTPWEIAAFYTDAFFADTAALNILRPTIVCKATDHIDDMIKLIARIEKAGATYLAGGNLYFDIATFPAYGKLGLLTLDDLKAGARIKVDQAKKNPHDFVLWFTRGKFERQAMVWDSPWGKGYPGWHIECSAMSMRYLGEQFDIHCGGIDHIAVHHTNEIAQSEAATGKKWVNYWLHAEFLILDKERMSKSHGNFITLSSLVEEGFHPLDYRYLCLGAHYRTQLKFSLEGLEGAKNARRNLVERVLELKDQADENHPFQKPGRSRQYLESFAEHLAADLNIPQALSDLWNLTRDPDIGASEKLAAIYEMDRVFALGLKEEVRSAVPLAQELSALIEEREQARRKKDFSRADEIRKLLESRGILLEDTAQGVRWRKR